MIPVRALEALEAGSMGKGELITLCRLARYVPGKTPAPVEATTAELVEVLGIPERTLQRHLVTLGSSGVVRCRQPQRGHWIVFGLRFDPEEGDEPPKMADSGRQKWREPVVVPLSPLGDQFIETADEQQHLLGSSAQEPPKVAGTADEPPKVADCEAVERALREIGVKADVAREYAQLYTLPQVRAAIAAGRARGDVSNLAGFVVSALVEHWQLPDSARERREGPTLDDLYGGPLGRLIRT